MKANIYFGTVQCIGGGEIVAPVYCNGMRIGEATGLNGTQQGEEPYFPTAEEWLRANPTAVEQNMDMILDGGQVNCPRCGDTVGHISDQYADENPNSSDMYRSQLLNEHECEMEEDYDKSFDDMEFVNDNSY